MMVKKMQATTAKNHAHPGQAMIEYAGAMITGALIVATVVAIAPLQMGLIYNSVFANIQTYFSQQILAL